MEGFILRPQEFDTLGFVICQEEEAERSDRWEKFLTLVNMSLSSAPARDLSSSMRADNLELEDSTETAGSESVKRDDGTEQGAKLWGQLRESLWAIEQTSSISGRGLHPSSLSSGELGASNGAVNEEFSPPPLAARGDQSSISPEGAEGNGHTNGMENRGAVPLGMEEHLSTVGGEDSGEDSEDEFCDAAESTDVLPEGQSIGSPEPAAIESPWEEELRFLVRGGVPMALRGEVHSSLPSLISWKSCM